ncbi:MAG: hypothetical protein DRN16_02400 [Thermoplasmata archaeon]|nr:MAG: hypothetical protein DRN16_02400 [Thermoplasmata archaeon]
MKAYQILMFLFIFNMFLWVLVSVGAYTSFGTQYASNEFNMTSQNKQTALDFIDNFLLDFDIGIVHISGITSLIGALILGTAIFTFVSGKIASAPRVGYALFTYFFWNSYIKTTEVFYNLTKDIGGLPILGMITVIVGIVFIAGLYQMITGGWKSYE